MHVVRCRFGSGKNWYPFSRQGFGYRAAAHHVDVWVNPFRALFHRFLLHGKLCIVEKPSKQQYSFEVKKEIVQRHLAGETKMNLDQPNSWTVFVRVSNTSNALSHCAFVYRILDMRKILQDFVRIPDRETWRVQKMKWAKRKDPETGKNVNDVTKLIYNKQVIIAGIPVEADEYMLGSRSAVA